MSNRRDRDRDTSRGTKSRRDSYSDARPHRRHHDDNDSIDSGYGGSSATSSPRSPTKRHKLPDYKSSPRRDSRGAAENEDMRRPDADREEVSDSDSDYDPKAKYYVPVDDDTYKDISFQGGTSAVPEGERKKHKERSRRDDDDDHGSRRPGSSHRHRSTSSGESEFNRDDRARNRSRRDSASSRTGRRDSRHRRQLSPIMSEPSEDVDTSSETASRRPSSRRRHSRVARSRSQSRSRGGWETSSDLSADDQRTKSRRGGDKKTSRTRSISDTSSSRGRAAKDAKSPTNTKKQRNRSTSPEYKYEGAPDMEDAWFKSIKERLVKGVDMKQVRKVGLDAAAVAAIKVAVGTQVPWKQRIPKTIAVGAAAALTDFLVSKTNIQPKGMVGTVFIRQFAEIILANMIINPASAKITDKASKYVPIGSGGGAPAGGAKAGGGGGGGGSGGSGSRGGGGRGRR